MIFVWVVFGLVAGLLTKWLLIPQSAEGTAGTMLLGMTGALIGGIYAQGFGWQLGSNPEDYSDPVTFIPIVGLFSGKSTAHIASLSITFASDGIVSRITRHNEKAESGPGAKPSPGTVVISR